MVSSKALQANNVGVVWCALLLFAICFEGWVRKALPFIPGGVFYLAKDLVLLSWLVRHGIRKGVLRAAKQLMGPSAKGVLVAAFGWTLLEVFNPEQDNLLDGLFGMRSYWLWWVAPLVVASMLRTEKDRRRVTMVFVGISLVAAIYAFRQFESSGTDEINAYANTQAKQTVAMVGTTMRVRVTSTFSYITGFADFVQFAFLFMLSQLQSSRGLARWVLGLGLLAVGLTGPMSGSRSPLVVIAIGIIIILWTSGVIFSAGGRRMLIGVALVGALAPVMVPNAINGVTDRFSNRSETEGRFAISAQYIPFAAPFVAGQEITLSPIGTGTGTQQNAVAISRVGSPFYDYEPGRLLIELGVVGYLIYIFVRILLAKALWGLGKNLKRAGRKGEAGLAWTMCVLTFFGVLVFDHVFQALFFFVVGYLISILDDSGRLNAA
jgi:hypothetical protein